MKIAFVDGAPREAERGLSGTCQVCGSPVIAKCGEIRIQHWAHRSTVQCDHWWEPETEWHRNWKNQFPVEWQEIVQRDANGEKHIADIKTAHGRVIEFQYSFLKPAERRAREAFYGSMYWVVSGLRRSRDKSSFDKALTKRLVLAAKTIRLLLPIEGSALLRQWSDSGVGVLFDFEGEVLWHLSPKRQNDRVVLTPVPIENFVHALRSGLPIQGIPQQTKIMRRPPHCPTSLPLYGFERFSANNRKSRRTF